ncbi:HlyD family secretion protein [Leptolyngbya ohadii]|uniref:HlyD family secretion protein n=1 Tax=Leptolyngbya ohadii TaxID=1962290 RepID=UPI001CED8836|nr:HlyD family secretion protein [Leptolyngbya ohadii]
MSDTHTIQSTNIQSTSGRSTGTIAPQNPTSRPTERPTDRSTELPLVEAPAEPDVQAPADEVPAEKPRRPMKRSTKGILAAALGIGAIVSGTVGYRWWQFSSTHESTDNAAIAGHVYQVGSRIPGSVIQVPVEDNQEVQPGQLLVQLDPHDYQVKVQQAQAALNAAQRQAQAAQASISLAGQTTQGQTVEAQGNVSQAIAGISTAQATVAEAQAGVPAAQAELAQAQANLQKAQADFNRYQSLYESGAVSQQQLDSARATYQTAVAQRNAAQQGVAQAQAKLAQAQQGVTQAQAQLAASRGSLQRAQAGYVQTDVNRSQYEAANAAIAQAQATLADAQLQLSYTNITAPAEGRVGRKTVEVGQQVQSGQPMMAIVGDEMWITANFKETQVNKMHQGQAVEIKLDAFPGRTFTGHINSLSPASGSEFALLPPDNATGNFTKVVQRIPVKITFDADSIRGYEGQLSPGMSAEVTVATGE